MIHPTFKAQAHFKVDETQGWHVMRIYAVLRAQVIRNKRKYLRKPVCGN
jgi:hypothetical protein